MDKTLSCEPNESSSDEKSTVFINILEDTEIQQQTLYCYYFSFIFCLSWNICKHLAELIFSAGVEKGSKDIFMQVIAMLLSGAIDHVTHTRKPGQVGFEIFLGREYGNWLFQWLFLI